MSAHPSAPRFWPKLLVILGFLSATVLIALHGAAWYIITGRIETGFAEAVAQAAAEGWHIETASPRRAGWPWRASVALPNVVATRNLGGTQVQWRTERLWLTISPRDPAHLLIGPGGHQTLILGARPPIAIEAGAMQLRAALAGNEPLAVTADALSATASPLAIRAERLQAQITATALAGSADGIFLTPALPPPFNGGASLALRATLNHPFPLADTPAHSAANWQKGGGKAALSEFTLRLGPLTAEGAATGELDPGLQPALHATVRMRGSLEVLDAATAAGLVQPGPASAIRAVLNLLALAAGGGPVTLPVVLQDNTLTIARFPLFRMPMLEWSPP